MNLRILSEVLAERQRQDAKWGEQNHPLALDLGCSDRLEAALEARLACDAQAKAGRVTWEDIMLEELAEACAESDPAKRRAELVQVAAVALAMLEAHDRAAGGR